MALVGLAAVATAQTNEFVVIDNQTEKNDIDPDSLKILEKDSNVQRAIRSLLLQNG